MLYCSTLNLLQDVPAACCCCCLILLQDHDTEHGDAAVFIKLRHVAAFPYLPAVLYYDHAVLQLLLKIVMAYLWARSAMGQCCGCRLLQLNVIAAD